MCLFDNIHVSFRAESSMTRPSSMDDWCYVGVDVGSGSVRAALVSRNGRVTATAEEPIHIWQPQTDYYEQSSDDIWRKCCSTVKVKRQKRQGAWVSPV